MTVLLPADGKNGSILHKEPLHVHFGKYHKKLHKIMYQASAPKTKQFLVVLVSLTMNSKLSRDESSSRDRCPTFDSLDKDGNSLITADEAAELNIGWIMGDDGRVDREEWESIKTEIHGC